MARDAGRQLPFADEVPSTGQEGPHPADRQAPGARTPLGVRAGVRAWANREPRIAACGLGLEPGVVRWTVGQARPARGSCSPAGGDREYRVLSFTSISENALSFNILFFSSLFALAGRIESTRY